jgi:hypothetical protein
MLQRITQGLIHEPSLQRLLCDGEVVGMQHMYIYSFWSASDYLRVAVQRLTQVYHASGEQSFGYSVRIYVACMRSSSRTSFHRARRAAN